MGSSPGDPDIQGMSQMSSDRLSDSWTGPKSEAYYKRDQITLFPLHKDPENSYDPGGILEYT